MTPDQQWHWGEGNKFAMEAMKALLLLNGGGALALLTFFGTRGKMTAVTADAIGNELLSFAFSCCPTWRNCTTASQVSKVRPDGGTPSLTLASLQRLSGLLGESGLL